MSVVALFILGDSEDLKAWPMGEVVICSPSSAVISAAIQRHLSITNADALDRKSTSLTSRHESTSRMPSSA